MDNERKNPDQHQKGAGLRWGIGISIFLAAGFVALGFWAGGIGYRALRQGGNQLNDLGNLGSYLQGTTASFWALAGVLLIFVAFLVQRQQSIYQQEELEMTRSELEGQRKQIEAQNQSIKRQNFESAFFQLLNLHNQNVAQMRQTIMTWENGRTVPSYTIEGRTLLRRLVWRPQTPF